MSIQPICDLVHHLDEAIGHFLRGRSIGKMAHILAFFIHQEDDRRMIHRISIGAVFIHDLLKIHPVGLTHLFDLLAGTNQSNNIGMKIVDISGHQFTGIAFWIDGHEHGGDLLAALVPDNIKRTGNMLQFGGANIGAIGKTEINQHEFAKIILVGNWFAGVIGKLKRPPISAVPLTLTAGPLGLFCTNAKTAAPRTSSSPIKTKMAFLGISFYYLCVEGTTSLSS